MKAGVMEVPDAFIINKWDEKNESYKTYYALQTSLNLITPNSKEIPVFPVSSHTGYGIDMLVEFIIKISQQNPKPLQKKEKYFFYKWVQKEYGNKGIEILNQMGGIEKWFTFYPSLDLAIEKFSTIKYVYEPKKNLALLFGGRSTEHEISILSAKNIYNSLNKEKFEVKCIYIALEGKFFYLEIQKFPTTKEEIHTLEKKELFVRFDSTSPFFYIDKNQIYDINVDVFFIITHGTYGEDGSLQGLLRLLEIPFVGCDVLSSALCMDKEATKKILTANQIPVVPYVSCSSYEQNISYKDIVEELGLPLFVKPARQGSSVGVYKVKTLEELKEKVQNAFEYDTKIIIEKAIQGRELECSVLGNEEIQVLCPEKLNQSMNFILTKQNI